MNTDQSVLVHRATTLELDMSDVENSTEAICTVSVLPLPPLMSPQRVLTSSDGHLQSRSGTRFDPDSNASRPIEQPEVNNMRKRDVEAEGGVVLLICTSNLNQQPD